MNLGSRTCGRIMRLWDRLPGRIRSGGGRNVHLVAGWIGERPEQLFCVVTDYSATGSDPRGHARLGLVPGDPHDHMNRPRAVRAQLVHLLEPERRQALVSVHEILVRAVSP